MGTRDTDALIRSLAAEAGRNRRPRLRFNLALPLAAAVGFALAATMAFVFFDASDGLGARLSGPWLWRKLALMASAAAGAWFVLRDLAQPGRSKARVLAFGPAILALWLAVSTDASGLGLVGRSAWQVPSCLGAIVASSLPGLGIILLAVRTCAATTRPRSAGAAAGLLAGALGGSAYALACRNDGGVFVALWYGAAVVSTTSVGAVLGRRMLAW